MVDMKASNREAAEDLHNLEILYREKTAQLNEAIKAAAAATNLRQTIEGQLRSIARALDDARIRAPREVA